jgi:integrase
MVRVRPFYHDKKRWQVDIRFRWPEDRSIFRERCVAPVTSKSAAERWGRDREASLLARGQAAHTPGEPPKEIPLFKEFWKVFLESYCKAERLKASGIAGKKWAYEMYLRPVVGEKLLNEIGTEDIQAIKARMAKKSPKTVNNILTVLSTCLKFASKDGVRGQDGLGIIERAPRIRLQKTVKPKMSFYEPEDFQRLAEAAAKIDTRTHVLVLLGGDAGLRRGELIGLRWCDVDLKRRQITIRQAAWQGIVDIPKGGRERIVEMTSALHDALRRHQHLRSERVLCCDDGSPATAKMLRTWVAVAQRRATLPQPGALHILRHTFCSRLAMAGAPARAIQEAAGHADLGTTMRYMHLAPTARGDAIRLLDRPCTTATPKAAQG